jgi:predicted MFS family arabinose efflux permease
VLGSIAGGLLSERFGLSAVFWMCSATALLATLLAWQLSRRIHQTQAT